MKKDEASHTLAGAKRSPQQLGARRKLQPPPANPGRPARSDVGNQNVVTSLLEVADLLDISGANPFRVRAYRNAARTIERLDEDINAMLERGAALCELPGIGHDLAEKIAEIARTGTCSVLRQLRETVPLQVGALLKVPGLGPRRVQALREALRINSVDDLARAAREHQISQLPGFGRRSEERLLDALEKRLDRTHRFTRDVAEPTAESVLSYLGAHPTVTEITVAGSFRRGRDTVGDLDILVASDAAGLVVRSFCSFPMAQSVIAAGTTKASLLLTNGMQVDLRVVPLADFGAALVYFTGSKAHNIRLRQRAQSLGLKVNEYGVFKGRTKIGGSDEQSVYAAVGLPWIPPELREDAGEFQAAGEGRLPELVTLKELAGDLRVHTRDSDAYGALKELACAAGMRGLKYLAITNYSKGPGIVHRLGKGGLQGQCDTIDELNASGNYPVILKGVEVDVLEDGSLDLPNAVLGRLDLVVGAIHSHFDLSAEKQTARILRAIEHPHFSILAHPFGRLLAERDPYQFDVNRVMHAMATRGCFIEANSQPLRLDIWDSICRLAKEHGVLVSIASDAHRATDFDWLRLGVSQARRGWLSAVDVLNTRTVDEVRALLARTM